MKKVNEFMTKDVVYFSPEDPIFDVAKAFAELNISGAPVIEEEKLVGIISASDIIKFIDLKCGKLPEIHGPAISALLIAFLEMEKSHLEFKRKLRKVATSKVRDVMTKNVITVSPQTVLFDVASLMRKHDINRLPVMEDGKLRGIVTRADVIEALVD